MAWQLIYTSAPKLLEAGRTGFGTVARHRSVSGLLATSVERLSQFARLPGHDPKRVVYCHRIVNVGGSDYHVLSCLRDAGSDYTGRTNHIAHHLVAESREIASLIDAGITPGDVLRAMPWRSEWTESARYFDAAEEINLGALKSSKRDAWRALSGNAEHARLPWADTAQRGCYFVTPPELDLLPLISESLDEKIAAAWQTTFTTNLEPNDDVADFKWIGLPVASPLRSMAEASARPLFDLNSPATLPPPPARPAAPVEVAPAPSAVTSATTPAFTIPAPSLAPVRSGTTFTPTNNRRKTIDLGQSWAPEEKKEKPTGWISKVAAVLLVVLAIGGSVLGVRHFNAKRDQTNADNAYISQVELIFSAWNLQEIKSEILKWPRAKREPDLAAVKETLESIASHKGAETLKPQALDLALFPRSSGKCEELAKATKEWFESIKDATSTLDKSRILFLSTGLLKLQEAQKKLTSLNKLRAANNQLTAPKSIADRSSELYQAVLTLLKGEPLPGDDERKPEEWKSLLEAVGSLGVHRDGEAAWLKEWLESDSQPDKLAKINLLSDPATPAPKWLQVAVDSAIKKVADRDVQNQPVDAKETAEEGRHKEQQATDPNGADASHALSLVLYQSDTEEEGKEIKINEKIIGKASDKMRLLVGDLEDANRPYETWVYNPHFSVAPIFAFTTKASYLGDAKVAFMFSNESLTQISAKFGGKGCRLIGYSDENKNVNFDIWAINVDQVSTTNPIFTEPIEYVLSEMAWREPRTIEEINTYFVKFDTESPLLAKSYSLRLKNDKQQRIVNMLNSSGKKLVLHIGNSTRSLSENVMSAGDEIISKINIEIIAVNQRQSLINSKAEELANSKGNKTGSPNERERKRLALISDSDKLKEANIVGKKEIATLIENLKNLNPPNGEGMLKIGEIPMVKVILSSIATTK
jgi:hypothetical protein